MTNLTNVPFGAQANDARHEEVNKKGQNLFKGEPPDVFQKSFSILNDVCELRERVAQYACLPDQKNHQYVPNYEPLITKIRIGLRKSNYFSEPTQERDFVSMKGEKLNPGLKDLFNLGVKARDSDIRQVIRNNDLKSGYNAKNKVEVIEERVKHVSEVVQIQQLKEEIKIMISMESDPESQLFLLNVYQHNKHKGEVYLKEMLEGLSNESLNFLDM